MNRRSAILATIAGWLGVAVQAKAMPKAPAIETSVSAGLLTEPMTGTVSGVRFANDVFAYEVFRETRLLENGVVCMRFSGWLSAFRYLRTPAIELPEPVVEIGSPAPGFRKDSCQITFDHWNRKVMFDATYVEITHSPQG